LASPYVQSSLNITQKLEVLSHDSRYDLACACATAPDEHRYRSVENRWIYPVSFTSGKKTFLFKTLLSNFCHNNCKYCPLRQGRDIKRLSLAPYELAKAFLEYFRQGKVSGLFLSSGAFEKPDEVMNRINQSAEIIRRSGFRGYVHLKIIPGASLAAIRHSLSLATTVSLNIEFPGEEYFKLLAPDKNYHKDIFETIAYISRLRLELEPAKRPHQTTQFVIGAGQETDQRIIDSASLLYNHYKLNRVYFSAYQRGYGDGSISGEHSRATNAELLTREHRLYQVDWLLRKYGFKADEIPLEADGNLSLIYDPKEIWARQHLDFFPVNVNKADRLDLLRVPGLGAVSVERILSLRRQRKIQSLDILGPAGKRLKKALNYICF
jgi:predicted DNA-binding helix-hairpin-helix protein